MTVSPHSITEHLTLLQIYPAHEPRSGDPHYAAFNAARRRLEKLGALRCWIGNADCSLQYPIELHHAVVEFALANIVDETHFAQLYPEFHVTDDETFLTWVEGEGNLLPLCKSHHTGVLGVHLLPYPGWLPQRFLKAGIGAPMRVIRQGEIVPPGPASSGAVGGAA